MKGGVRAVCYDDTQVYHYLIQGVRLFFVGLCVLLDVLSQVEIEVVAKDTTDAVEQFDVDAALFENFVHVGASAADLRCKPNYTVSVFAEFLFDATTYMHDIAQKSVVSRQQSVYKHEAWDNLLITIEASPNTVVL